MMIMFWLCNGLIERNIQTIKCLRFIDVQRRSIGKCRITRFFIMIRIRQVIITDYLDGNIGQTTLIEFIGSGGCTWKGLMATVS